jgi:hypothetical protein
MGLLTNPDAPGGLRFAAASDAMAGRLEQAHNAVARLRQLNSTLRVSNLKEVLGPYRLAENISQYEEGLRRSARDLHRLLARQIPEAFLGTRLRAT